MDIKNIESCLKCGEVMAKGDLKNHICYANLKKDKKLIDEILGNENIKVEKKGVKNGKT